MFLHFKLFINFSHYTFNARFDIFLDIFFYIFSFYFFLNFFECFLNFLMFYREVIIIKSDNVDIFFRCFY